MKRNKVTAIVGAQYGSEGKGVVAAEVADDHDIWIRTGGPNAGHTFAFMGEIHKQLMLPVGWMNPNAVLILGAGAVVDPTILVKEMDAAEKVLPGVWERTYVDASSIPLMLRHVMAEGGVDGEMHRTIGSTGKGVGAARMEHMARQDMARNNQGVKDMYAEAAQRLRDRGRLIDTQRILGRSHGARIGLEGTQGFGLSLIHGQWPYVTSADTTVGTLCAHAGVPVTDVDRVILVTRVLPIRVAGNSGPMQCEINWESLSQRLGREVVERTTVTNKIRRIGLFDLDMVVRAARINGATEVALTFADYADPKNLNVREADELSENVLELAANISAHTNCPISAIGTGFDSLGWKFVNLGLVQEVEPNPNAS